MKRVFVSLFTILLFTGYVNAQTDNSDIAGYRRIATIQKTKS